MALFFDLMFGDYLDRELAKGTIKNRQTISRYERKYPGIKKRYKELKGCDIKDNPKKYIPVGVSKCHENETCIKLMEEFGCSEEEISDFTECYFCGYA